MLSPLLIRRCGVAWSVAGLLTIAGLGFGVLAFVGGGAAVAIVAIGWSLWAFGGSASATVTTGTIISAARPERAGAVSAVAQAGSELGGALGIAVLGSLGTALYRNAVSAALPDGISPELAAVARDTLGGALTVASQLPDAAAAASLVLVAGDALTTAVRVTCAVGAVISIASAAAAAYYLRPRQSEPRCEMSCEAEAAAAA
jgi:DHA2 family multidrug resistance protein-like MFS transporter